MTFLLWVIKVVYQKVPAMQAEKVEEQKINLEIYLILFILFYTKG